MRKEKKRVAVIFGGTGYEHSVSVLGARYIMSVIDRERYTPMPVYITRRGEWRIISERKLSDPDSARGVRTYPVRIGKRCGFVSLMGIIPVYSAFPILHGDGGEDGVIQGALLAAGIRLVGCATGASAVACDKIFAKSVAELLGIPTVPWVPCISRGAPDIAAARAFAEGTLGYPMFIKPACLGSSVGCYAVYTPDGFDAALTHAAEVGSGRVIIEKKLASPREIECALIETDSGLVISSPGEIAPGADFYSYTEKYSENSRSGVYPSANLTSELTERVKEYSAALAECLGVRSVSRIDYFLSDGELYFNEINTMPGMTPASLYPLLVEGLGISPAEMVSALIEGAYDRHL